MKNIYIILIVFSFYQIQCQNIIRGKIIDLETGKNISFANVFIANTLVGTTSNEDGVFVLDGLYRPKYELTVSCVGYELYQLLIDFENGNDLFVTIPLKEDVTVLNEIVVNEDTLGWYENFEVFKEKFLGNSANARICTIINPQSIHLFYDKENNILSAHSKAPMIIENRALGYRIEYSIKQFEYNFKNGEMYSLGISRFEASASQNEVEKNKVWEYNRRNAYEGSVMHFIQSLYLDALLENGFEVRKMYSVEKPREKKKILVDVLSDTLICASELLDRSNKSRVQFKGRLSVVYQNKDKKTNRNGYKRKSIINFLDDLTIYPDGYYEDARNLLLEGYWAISENMANQLPFDWKL